MSKNELSLATKLPCYGPLQVTDYKQYLNDSKNDIQENFTKSFSRNIEKTNFEMITSLGSGSFGQVILVRSQIDQQYYAMKAMLKDHIIKTKQLDHTLNEKRVLQCLNFPFAVHLEYFIKDNSYIYFIMPYISGGEMFTHLRKFGKFNENVARFYAAQVVLGFEYMHHMEFIYRDLKPENLLIDYLGYLKITDFGFTKPVQTRTWTLCGTPQYLAPEMIVGIGYGVTVDWWSLGVLMYEMSAGFPPFNSRVPMKIFQKITSGKYTMPIFFPSDLKDIVDKLLQVDLSRRYGNLKNGVSDIKDHSWFRPIEWLSLLNRKIKPPFVPENAGEGDVTNFPDQGEEIILTIAEEEEYEAEFKSF